jgi:hypothetical protein
MTDKEIYERVQASPDLKGTTVNERLYLTGLTEEYNRSIISYKEKAKTILEALEVDREAIDIILKNK